METEFLLSTISFILQLVGCLGERSEEELNVYVNFNSDIQKPESDDGLSATNRAAMVSNEETINRAGLKCMAGGRPCQFPFIQNHRKFYACTSSHAKAGDTKPRCFNGKDFAECNENCPGVGEFQKIEVHPDNQPGKCSCGVPNAPLSSNRIIGGLDAPNGKYPWQVAITKGEGPGTQFCGGSLISNRHVLTAAHCLTYDANRDPTRYAVLGDTTLGIKEDSERLIIPIKEVIAHPGFAYPQPGHDIAVLVLAEPVDLQRYPHIKPVCLSGQSWEDAVGRNGVVTGWGVINDKNIAHSNLQEVVVPILSRENCGGNEHILTESMRCAGFLKTGGKDACQGDSGGPLVVKNEVDNNGAATLLGVVSGGERCALKNYPGIYTDVSMYMRNGWIQKQIGNAETCPPPARSTWSLS